MTAGAPDVVKDAGETGAVLADLLSLPVHPTKRATLHTASKAGSFLQVASMNYRSFGTAGRVSLATMRRRAITNGP